MRNLARSALLPVLLVIAAAGAGAWWWATRNSTRVFLRTAPLKRGDVVATISATGTLEPIEVVDVGAQVAGLIKSFGPDRKGNPVDYGSQVDEGTVLAQIDDSVYAAEMALANAQVEQAKAGELHAAADLEQLKAKLVQADADWKRARELDSNGLIPHADFDGFKAAFEIAKANIAQGDAALAQARAATLQNEALLVKARRNLDFCTIKSPVRGVIIDRRVNIGQTVVSSLNAPSLFLIAKDLTRMQIWAAVNEADVGRIVPGSPVTFACDAFPGRKFNGTVGKVRLNATTTQNIVMYTVEINTENPQGILLPYLTANVRFVLQKENNALLVPNSALHWAPNAAAQTSPGAKKTPGAESAEASAGKGKGAKQESDARERLGQVWVRDGDSVRPVDVKIGTTDGVNTAIVGEGLDENVEVVTGEVTESSKASASNNPFIPQVRKR